MTEQKIDFKQVAMDALLEYESVSHWLAPYMFMGWMSHLHSRYIVRKVRRKFKRYQKFQAEKRKQGIKI